MWVYFCDGECVCVCVRVSRQVPWKSHGLKCFGLVKQALCQVSVQFSLTNVICGDGTVENGWNGRLLSNPWSWDCTVRPMLRMPLIPLIVSIHNRVLNFECEAVQTHYNRWMKQACLKASFIKGLRVWKSEKQQHWQRDSFFSKFDSKNLNVNRF